MDTEASRQPLPSPEELQAFIGPHEDRYKRRFGAFVRSGPPGYAPTWNWPVFFAGFWWYLYRKMYLWAVVDLAVAAFFGWTLFVPLLWAAARALTGNYLYFLLAAKRTRESRSLLPPGSPPDHPAHLARLSESGGVHAWVLWAGLAFFILLAAASALLMLAGHHVYENLPFEWDRWRWPGSPGRWT